MVCYVNNTWQKEKGGGTRVERREKEEKNAVCGCFFIKVAYIKEGEAKGRGGGLG